MSKFAIETAEKYKGLIKSVTSAVRRVEEFLGPEDDWVERYRRRLYVAFDGVLGHSTVDEKTRAEYFTTAKASPDEVEEAIHPRYERNIVSTRKYRMRDGEREWTVGSWVHDPADTNKQHHIFLFETPDGRTDIYGHRETSVRDPVGHLTDAQTHGDPNGRVRALLSEAGLSFDRRNIT